MEQLSVHAEPMNKWPAGFGHLLGCAQLALKGAVAVVLVRGNDWPDAEDGFRQEIATRYLPTLVMTGSRLGFNDPHDSLPLFEGRIAIDGNTTAYVCRNFSCDLPATSPRELARQLDETIEGFERSKVTE